MGVGSSAAAPAGVKVLVKQRYQAYLPPSINRKATLTPDKVKLVHDHWSFIADEVKSACVLKLTDASNSSTVIPCIEWIPFSTAAIFLGGRPMT